MKTRLSILALVFGLLLASCGGGSDVGNPHTPSSEQSFDDDCNDDVFTCGDGSEVMRDPDNNCEFEACPGSGALNFYDDFERDD